MEGAVGEASGLFGVVADHYQRDVELAPQVGKGRLDRVAGIVVECRGRLVEQQHGGPLGERAGEHRPLLLADREPAHIALGEGGVEAGEAEAAAGVELGPGEPGREGEVRPDSALEQRGQLRHQRDFAAQRQRIVPGQRPAAVGDRPGLGVDEPVEQAQQGRLAAPGGPEDRGRPGVDLGVDRVEHPAVAAGEADVAKLEQHRRMIPHRSQEASRGPPAVAATGIRLPESG